MIDADTILSSFELVAERTGDPTPLVYERLFEKVPNYRVLFQMDTDGGVRGNMLQTCFDCMLGLAENALEIPRAHLVSARLSHDAYGLSGDEMNEIFRAIRDVFRDVSGADWRPDTEAEWNKLLAALADIEED